MRVRMLRLVCLIKVGVRVWFKVGARVRVRV